MSDTDPNEGRRCPACGDEFDHQMDIIASDGREIYVHTDPEYPWRTLKHCEVP